MLNGPFTAVHTSKNKRESTHNVCTHVIYALINLYRAKVTVAVMQVRVKCLKNSGRQWTLWHLNAVR